MILASLDAAKRHLAITDPARDAEVQYTLEHASAIIFEYIGAQADASWDETSAPATAQRATLEMLAHLWEHRGDDVAPDQHDQKLWEGISLLCMRLRDPAVA